MAAEGDGRSYSFERHLLWGNHLAKTGVHYEAAIPSGIRTWLYRLALDRCHLDTLLDRFVAGPFIASAEKAPLLDRGDANPDTARIAVPRSRPELVGGIDV